MKPKGTRKSYAARLTAPEKKEIIALSKRVPRLPQIEIARRFGCLPQTVRQVQRDAGLKLFREITGELETKIVDHLRKGHGQFATSRKFRVSFHKMRPLM